MVTQLDSNPALIVVDMQVGFADPSWGAPANPDCERNVDTLIRTWAATSQPIVVVRHDSIERGSPLHPAREGNRLLASVDQAPRAVLVSKTVNSCFYGDPDLHAWLQDRDIEQVVVCGIQTNMCVETTARMAGNLGYDVVVPLDATRTFALTGPTGPDGRRMTATAQELMAATAINLQGGGFATVTSTRAVLDEP